nr:aminotransferase [Lachnospira sp.]
MKETNLDFDEYIERRNTDCLKYDFAVRRGKPADVLPLWVADMDFRAPSTVLTKIKERVDHGIFGYTEPRDDYYNTVIDW